MTPPQRDQAGIQALAKELTALRQRGFFYLDGRSSQKPLHVPFLEELAGRYLGDRAPLSRRAMLQQFLGLAIDAYAAIDPDGAWFIKTLFFDTREEAKQIGLRLQGELLESERLDLGFERAQERQFREIQKIRFREFAAFLIDLDTRDDR